MGGRADVIRRTVGDDYIDAVSLQHPKRSNQPVVSGALSLTADRKDIADLVQVHQLTSAGDVQTPGCSSDVRLIRQAPRTWSAHRRSSASSAAPPKRTSGVSRGSSSTSEPARSFAA